MWYNINWNEYGVMMLPSKWRDRQTIAFVRALVKAINQVYYSWSICRKDNIYKLVNTGQICSLRGSLNDKFDSHLRRIYIDDGSEKDTTYIYTEAEAQGVYTNTEDESNAGTLYIYTEAETSDSGYDFIVYVPFQIVNLRIYELRAHINFYKQGGRRYAIIAI